MNHKEQFNDATETLSLERLPQVRARTGLSRSEIYRRIAAGDFPKPIRIGERASAWVGHEVSDWIASRIAARDLKGQRRHSDSEKYDAQAIPRNTSARG